MEREYTLAELREHRRRLEKDAEYVDSFRDIVRVEKSSKADIFYKKNLLEILTNGYYDKNPRPKWADGTPAHSKFITQVYEKYDISKGEYPIPTLRNTAILTGIKEILWIYNAQDNSLDTARNFGVNWWDSWDIGDNTIGQRYGATVRKYDLMNRLLDSLENDPFSRRHIIDLYQYADLDETKGLYPCAFQTQWSVREVDGEMYLDMTLTQRSNDYIVASHINKCQYVALQMMVAGHLGYKVGVFVHFIQNLHIYDRHLITAKMLLDTPSKPIRPYMKISGNKNFYEYTIKDFTIGNIEGIPKLENNLELAI